jgi:hypothetical protein
MTAVTPGEVLRTQAETAADGRPAVAGAESAALPRSFTVGFAVLLVLLEVAWLGAIAYGLWLLVGVVSHT